MGGEGWGVDLYLQQSQDEKVCRPYKHSTLQPCLHIEGGSQRSQGEPIQSNRTGKDPRSQELNDVQLNIISIVVVVNLIDFL